MIEYKQANTDSELLQILDLQQRNLPKNLSKEEMEVQGFLTIEHDFALLKRMNEACPHTIAVENNNVVGYALSMHPKFGEEIELLKSMFAKINEVFSGGSYLVMGQVCISKDYRGKGLFRGLYQNMQRFTKADFEAIITEVDVKNTRSMHAHKAIGFNELARYSSDDREWSLVLLE
ncbi:GNAT family N-acetyltransferase [Croceivirga thetidis]|uniref:GNAT family N-acetyltransferase n=1 Tax=Croceivirga thetidis TaxID=2721623 RepID=A0ABX1GNJ8_9FLAO|nr:GNAT family N-acetyltransferase [Croceivirga thetidis]NKI31490.1 GNAT family N-acetyltransferase [Croceivirga thetidis]